MKKAFIAIAAMLCSLALGARDIYPKPYKTQALYPEGQASGRGIIENGREITLGAGESNGYSTHSMKGCRKSAMMRSWKYTCLKKATDR